MANYFETGEFPLLLRDEGLRKGRSAKDGYARGWGLEYGGIREEILSGPVYKEAAELATGRTIQTELCRMNLFLLAKYYLPGLLEKAGSGSIFEFGSFRGGSAIFLAAVCRRLNLNVRVYGLDTFEGMPPTNKDVDAHNAGDFAGVDLAELRAYVDRCGLSDQLEFVQGTFEKTASPHLASAAAVLLAHIDCDVRDSVAFAWEAVKPRMAPGGYVVFDDAHTSSCLGATEVVEDLVIRRDGLNCEQIWPHFVFRVWPARRREAAQPVSASALELEISRLEDELESATQRIASLKAQHAPCINEIEEAKERLGQLEWSLTNLGRAHDVLKQQVAMARTSRWVRLGRLFGVGPRFETHEL